MSLATFPRSLDKQTEIPEMLTLGEPLKREPRRAGPENSHL
ncbi:hypothetical protein [Burkholderia glumae]|nr:hypothetical protein [Burkholderia glumae]